MKVIDPIKIKKILVIRKHNQIGDMIVSIPMYYALKKKFPKSKITLLASKTNYSIPFKEINPYIDEVVIFDKSTILNQLKLIKQLRQSKFDIAIIPSTIRFSTTSILISWLAGIKIRVGVEEINGMKNQFSFLLNIKQKFKWIEKNTHQILRNLEVVEQIGCKLNFNGIFEAFPKIQEDEKYIIKKIIEKKFNSKNLLIGIHPGAGKIQNIWSINNFLTLIKILRVKYKANFIITAGYTDDDIIQKIQTELENLKIPFFLAKNFQFKTLMALIDQCDLFISNDTGVMHIAGLTDTVLIALMIKSNVKEWSPLGKNKFYISSSNDDINKISVEEVLNFCDKIFKLIK